MATATEKINSGPKPVIINKAPLTKDVSWEPIMIIFLFILVIGLPIFISVWDVGTPIPGYS